VVADYFTIKIYHKGGVVFMDFVKESMSCDKLLPRFLGSGHRQMLEEARLTVHERWFYV
jgi:hypothetical protein